MDKKILEIAAIVFALGFVMVFLIIWRTSQSIVSSEVNELNSLYGTNVAFDSNLFDNKAMTGQSIINFIDELANGRYLYTKLYVYDKATGQAIVRISDYANPGSALNLIKNKVESNSEYRTFLHYGESGAIDGIEILKIGG